MSSIPETPSSPLSGDAHFFGETRIRPALTSDCDRLAELAAAAYERYLKRMDKKPAPMTEDYTKRIAEGEVFVLEILPANSDREKSDSVPSPLVGFVVLLPEKEILLLDNVAVDPAVQGQGYGKTLMAFAEEYARKAGCRRIVLYTNEVMTENLRLYSRLDYTETHRAGDGGFNRVFFSRTL